MAMVAILLCDLPWLLQLLCWSIIGGWVWRQWQALGRPVQLAHYGGPDDCANHWELQYATGESFEGVLLQQGYRSAGLLVLVFGRQRGGRVYIPVWTDAVSTEQFSYLNLQLMFNTRGQR